MKRIFIKQTKDGNIMLMPGPGDGITSFEVDDQMYITLKKEAEFYRINEGKIEFDSNKFGLTYPFLTKEGKIESLKQELTQTDYKVVKCFEAQMVGVLLPYDIKDLYEKRENIRKRIRILEGK